MHVIIKEYRLIGNQNIILRRLFKHLSVCDLAMDQTMAQRILSIPKYLLIAFHYICDRTVTNCMCYNLDSVFIGDPAEFIHFLLADALHSKIARIISILFSESRSPSAQRTIFKKLQRPESQSSRIFIFAVFKFPRLNILLKRLQIGNAHLVTITELTKPLIIDLMHHLENLLH